MYLITWITTHLQTSEGWMAELAKARSMQPYIILYKTTLQLGVRNFPKVFTRQRPGGELNRVSAVEVYVYVMSWTLTLIQYEKSESPSSTTPTGIQFNVSVRWLASDRPSRSTLVFETECWWSMLLRVRQRKLSLVRNLTMSLIYRLPTSIQ